MNENNKELIAQLEQIDRLLCENSDLKDYAEEGVVLETAKRIENVRKERGNPPMAPAVFQTMPIFPLSETHYLKEEEKFKNTKKIMLALLAATVFICLLTFVFDLYKLTTLTTIAILATGAYAFYFSGIKGAFTKKKKEYVDSVDTYNNTITAFRSGLECFEKEKADGHQAIKAYGAKHRKAFADYCQAIDDFDTNHTEANAKIQSNLDEIHRIDLVPDEYLYCVDRMIPMLRAGRADSLKEALNMAIEQARQEAEDFARRLEAEQRQREEERRTAILAAQAEEQRRHNQEMEHQQALQAEQARHDAQQAKRQAEDAARQERFEQQKLAGDRCSSCANFGSCHARNKNSLAGLNCGASARDNRTIK